MLIYPNKAQKWLPLSPENVHMTDGFWRDVLKTVRGTTILDVFDKFESCGTIENFENVRDGKTDRKYNGQPFFDGLFYETIRAASDLLANQWDAGLDARLDRYIAIIEQTQAADADNAWINTFTTLKKPDNRWGLKEFGNTMQLQHNFFNAGCLIEAGIHHYRATGKLSLLSCAVRFAAYMCRELGFPPKKNMVSDHPMIEEAAFKLYGLITTENLHMQIDPDDLLALAKFTIEGRGHYEGRVSLGAYSQDHAPFEQQSSIVGHAVRATIFWTGVAAAAAVTGDERYLNASRRIWNDLFSNKIYISGAAGAIKDEEKFGSPYELPNDGYMEICASAGVLFLTHSLAMMEGKAGYFSEIENSLYNGILPGVSQSGNLYYYNSPLISDGRQRRWNWNWCPCCPPMYLKSISQVPGMLYAINGNTVSVNLYAASNTNLTVNDTAVRIEQSTKYPADGDVAIRVSADHPAVFTIRFLIPDWCVKAIVHINGKPCQAPPKDGWVTIAKEWSGCTVVRLQFDMPVRRMMADSRVQAAAGKVALKRGPVLYCLEAIDNEGHAEVALEKNTEFELVPLPEGLDSILPAIRFQDARGGIRTAVPYYLWANRLPSAMAVWQTQQGLKNAAGKNEDTLYRQVTDADFQP